MRVLTMLAIVVFALSACGVKPGDVEPPEGSDGRAYPATYPKTDSSE